MPVASWVDPALLGSCLVAASYQAGPGAAHADIMARTWELYGATSNPTASVDVEVVISRNGVVTNRYSYEGLTKEKQLMTAMTMDDTATITVSTTDDHGDATSDALTYTGSDAGANLTLTPSADTKSCVCTPVAEGTGITVTVTDPSAPSSAPFVASFDIGPGPTSAVVGSVTVNTGANVAPPAP